MVSVTEATSLIQQYTFRLPKERIKIEKLMGRTLAESIKTDNDFPPFDRVAMDGIAIFFESFQAGWRDFKIEGTQPAGQPRLTLKDTKNCLEVMTGAMLPIGCDTVIRYEDISVSNRIARVKLNALEKGNHIHFRSHDARKGDVLLTPGMRITAAEVALLASLGRAEAEVFSFPKIAIISTGNELVDIHDRPLPHQIRRSNSYALQASLVDMGAQPTLFHLPDDQNVMERELIKIMADHEILILSGGVSKGKFDFVPTVMDQLGVVRQFHEVSQKPGKPFWFGVTKKHAVFALPGNPVSTFMCFYRYIKPWLLKNMGIDPGFGSAILARDFSFAMPLTYFLQVRIEYEKGMRMAYPEAGGGSGDFANLKSVDGFIELPPSANQFGAGESFPYIPFRNP